MICIRMTPNAEVTDDCSLMHSIEDGDEANSCEIDLYASYLFWKNLDGLAIDVQLAKQWFFSFVEKEPNELEKEYTHLVVIYVWLP